MKFNFFKTTAAVVMSLFIISPAFAIDSITEEGIGNFLDSENKFIKMKDVEGYMRLMTDDFVYIDRIGNIYNKTDTRLQIYKTFIVSLHIFHESTLKSATISTDGKSASAVMINDSKHLIENSGNRRVVQNFVEEQAELVLINGEIKYKKARFIRDL